MAEAERLPGMGGRGKKAYRNHDYIDLFPGRVFPTGEIDVLERGNHLLVIKSYEYGQQIKKPHHRIFDLLVRLGELTHALGSVTVVCVWGLGKTPREVVIYDHMGISDRQALTRDEWREWLRRWWDDHKGIR